MLIPAARVRWSTGCKNAFDLLLFPRVPLRYALPWRAWRLMLSGRCGHRPLQMCSSQGPTHRSAPTDGLGPRFSVGADAHIRPPHQLPSTARPAAAKREAAQCDDHPDALRTIRHGTAVGGIAEENSVPEGQPKSTLAPIRRPPSRAEGHCTGARQAPFSFGPCNRAAVGGSAAYGCGIPLAGTARFSFGNTKRETGGVSRWTSPLREQIPSRPPDGGPPNPIVWKSQTQLYQLQNRA